VERILAAFPVGAHPQDYAPGLERVAADLEREVHLQG
jgi:hypothetical protein